jgi:hypothetical protein
MAFDNYADRTDSGPAKSTAVAIAGANRVWGQRPAITSADVAFPVCGDSFEAGPSAPVKLACIQVTAFRNQEHGNPLSTIFAQWFGVQTAGVAARATAEAKEGNATDCLKPLAMPDRWVERSPVTASWSTTSTFNKWNPSNPTVLLAPPDSYTAATALASGSGLTITADLGTQVVLNPGTTAIPVSPVSPWRYLAVQIPASRYGNDTRANIEQCAAAPVGIGDRLNLQGGSVGAGVTAGLQILIARDPGASWNTVTRRIDGSCADATPRCASMSPRLVALPLYDLHDLADRSRTGVTSIRVTNIIGLFIESVSGTTVTGRLTTHPGLRQATALTLTDASSFLRASLLIE